jgi:hypothetical protein
MWQWGYRVILCTTQSTKVFLQKPTRPLEREEQIPHMGSTNTTHGKIKYHTKCTSLLFFLFEGSSNEMKLFVCEFSRNIYSINLFGNLRAKNKGTFELSFTLAENVTKNESTLPASRIEIFV